MKREDTVPVCKSFTFLSNAQKKIKLNLEIKVNRIRRARKAGGNSRCWKTIINKLAVEMG